MNEQSISPGSGGILIQSPGRMRDRNVNFNQTTSVQNLPMLKGFFFYNFFSLQKYLIYLYFRCYVRWTGGIICYEITTMLCYFWFFGAAKWFEVQRN